MMTPQIFSNFASSDEPRMNLRVQSGLAHSRLTLDAFSNPTQPYRAGLADHVLPGPIKSRIFLPGWNCVSNSLQGHQLIRRVGRFNLWKQVQKMESSVDITKVGA
jgi:hypothetical protein